VVSRACARGYARVVGIFTNMHAWIDRSIDRLKRKCVSYSCKRVENGVTVRLRTMRGYRVNLTLLPGHK